MSLNLALDFHIAAEKYRAQTAIVYNGLEITYEELANSVCYWAIFLRRLGVRRGDNVCIVMPNVPEFTIAYFAILHLGAVVVPCNTLLTSRELSYQLVHSDARYILTSTGCMTVCVEAMCQVDSCVGVIIAGSKECNLKQLPQEYHHENIYWIEDEIHNLKSYFPFDVETLTVTAQHESVKIWRNCSSDTEEDSLEQIPWPTGVSFAEEGGSSVTPVSSTIPVGSRTEALSSGILFVPSGTCAQSVLENSGVHRNFEDFVSSWESTSSANGQFHTTWSPAPAATNPDDPAVILYTSGTTGFPKGAQLTHFNLYSNAQFVRESMTGYQPGKRVLAILPFYHSFGQTVVQNAALFSGATIVMVPRFDPKRVLQTIVAQNVDVVAGVPTMLIHLVRMQMKLGLDVKCVRQIISGGSALSVSAYEKIHEVFPESTILEGYGLSETSPLATAITPSMVPHPGSIGREIDGVQVRVMRPDHTFANPGEVGEIVIRGHNVMKGYHKDPLATERTFLQSWFCSGDLGYCDEEGFFYLVDRRKDIIIRAGMNIYPREIEEILHAHPAVMLVSVVGVPHPIHGEDVVCFVVLNDGFQDVDELTLSKYCRGKLAAYKCPQKIIFLEEMPKGVTGKILKRELKEQFLELT